LEGYYHRHNDYPYASLEDYKKFIVNLAGGEQNLVFYNSQISNRWWLEVNPRNNSNSKTLVIACSHQDYLTACKHEIPERWWRFFDKMS